MESHQIAEIIGMIVVGGTFVLLAYSPLPRAIAQAISHRIMHGRSAERRGEVEEGRVDDLSGDVAALRRALEETQERLDFTERMLAQQRERGALGAGQGGTP